MRVLVVTNDLPPRLGGIQNYVDQLCRGMVAAGDEVTVYASAFQGDALWDEAAPFQVIRDRSSVLLPTPRVLRHTLRLIEHSRAEVVIFGAAFPLGLMGPRIRKKTGRPYIAFTHGLEVSAVRAPGGAHLLRTIGRSAAAITFVSHWCDDSLRAAFGSGPEFAVLSPAVDPSVFHPGVDATAIRLRHGLADAPVVVCISRLVERKGQDRLIAALSSVRQQVPEARLLIVGGGPYEEALRTLAVERGVEQYVVFAGPASEEELPAYYAAGDVFAMPCRERKRGLEVEAFGIVFIQAQAVGVPVVAGDIGGVPDALRANSTGLLVDGSEVSEISEALIRLLNDTAAREQMGAAAAEFVSAGFTWEGRAKELRALLARAVASGSLR
ncbi:MAG: glycosyltransferase family 4 protein [Actinomycetes bacterium]